MKPRLSRLSANPSQIVPGDFTNIKITRQEDLLLAEALGGMAGGIRASAVPTNPVTSGGTPNDLQTDNAVAETGLTLQASSLDAISSFPEYRTGLGYDVHAFADPSAGRRLFLGGVEIPHDRGLEGHSDADVLLHAVCDALLGAASLGDIGILFPNTDDTYKGIASLRLLEVVASGCGKRAGVWSMWMRPSLRKRRS